MCRPGLPGAARTDLPESVEPYEEPYCTCRPSKLAEFAVFSRHDAVKQAQLQAPFVRDTVTEGSKCVDDTAGGTAQAQQ